MGQPATPRPKYQLNDPTTTLDGLNCTPTSGALAADRSTLGKLQLMGGQVRAATGDKLGGTSLRQIADALKRWGVTLTKVATPGTLVDLYANLRAGSGALVQGAEGATRGTPYQASETFIGNHCWYVNEGKGWRLVKGYWWPSELLVYDPLADGRRAGIARSPFWISRSIFERFTSKLDVAPPYAEIPVYPKPGQAWYALTRDTEPHVHLRRYATPTIPFPRPMVAVAAAGKRVNIRSGASTQSPVIRTIGRGQAFVAFQQFEGQKLSGSTRWYGSHDGDEFVHSSGLK